MAKLLARLLGRMTGQDLSRIEGATKFHDVEARFRGTDGRTIAKVNQSIWNNGAGSFRVKVKRWPGSELDAPLVILVDGREMMEVAMSGATLRHATADPTPAGITRLDVGQIVSLRRGDTRIEAEVELD